MARGVKVTDKQLIDIADLYIKGYTLKEIALECGLSKLTVFNAVHHNDKCKEYMEQMTETYKNELVALSIDTIKEALLDEDLNPYVKPQYLKMALQYSGLESGASTVEVEAETKVNVNEISLDELAKLKFK